MLRVRREIYQHGWAADPMLEQGFLAPARSGKLARKVLLIGAPAAEINFQR